MADLELESLTVAAIYEAYVDSHDEIERTYLGASIIGDECERKLWYGFRWTTPPEQFDGRMLRLFQTGHREEARMIDDLRRSGVEVWETDPETGRQWGVEEVGGHFRGHLDGVALGVKEAPRTAHLLECKTHNAKSFAKLRAEGVRKSKPLHYAQMQVPEAATQKETKTNHLAPGDPRAATRGLQTGKETFIQPLGASPVPGPRVEEPEDDPGKVDATPKSSVAGSLVDKILETKFVSTAAVVGPDGRGWRIKKDGDGYIVLRMQPAATPGKAPTGEIPTYSRPAKGSAWTAEEAARKAANMAFGHALAGEVTKAAGGDAPKLAEPIAKKTPSTEEEKHAKVGEGRKIIGKNAVSIAN
jgi:hypothetical protein